MPDVDYIIKLNDNISIKMQYPTYLSIMDLASLDVKSNTEQTFAMILKCIESVMTEDENKRLKQLTQFLVEKYITEEEYIEYKCLSEMLRNEMHSGFSASNSKERRP